MDFTLKKLIIDSANKFEVSTFTEQDPSFFLRYYPINQQTDVEVISFIAAMLSFGNRKQFIPKIHSILDYTNQNSLSVSNWILKDFPNFPRGQKKFYRFYSFDELCTLFSEIKFILQKHNSLGNFFLLEYQKTKLPLYTIISNSFPNSKIVPKGKSSANKRIHMFLRWMVRQNSPVDLGIWNWYSQKELLIPLDTHVMTQAANLNLIPQNSKADFKTAIKLTSILKEIFPDDPCKADFALFGLGIN